MEIEISLKYPNNERLKREIRDRGVEKN